MKAAFCFVIYLSFDFVASNIEECSRDYSNRGGGHQESKAPWLAAIGVSRPEEEFQMICSGSILTKKLIVSAAHCFAGPDQRYLPTHVRAGDNYIESRFAEERKILDVKIHPDYDSVSLTYYFDIAIITMDEEFKFSSRISPICLPVTASLRPGDGIGISVQGWGATEIGKNRLEISKATAIIRSKGKAYLTKVKIIFVPKNVQSKLRGNSKIFLRLF